VDGGISSHEDVQKRAEPSPGASALAHSLESLPNAKPAAPSIVKITQPSTPEKQALPCSSSVSEKNKDRAVLPEFVSSAAPVSDEGGMMGWLRFTTSRDVAGIKR
jgi:hypothetical protein